MCSDAALLERVFLLVLYAKLRNISTANRSSFNNNLGADNLL